MADDVVILNASSVAWERKRGLKPKGKRKAGQTGGKKKRRKRKVNMSGLKGHAKFTCICKNGCVCLPVKFIHVKSQTDPPPVCFNAINQTDPEETKKLTRTVGTEIEQHTNMLPKAGSYTVADRMKTKCSTGLERMRGVVKKNYHWTSMMVVLLLRVLFNLVVKLNWGWTAAVGMTSELLQVRTNTVFKLANNYLQSDVNLPAELPIKISGRGSAKFKANHGADKYSELKEVI